MTVRRLDANGDIATSGIQFISEAEEIAQTVKTRLKLFLGEYFRDISDGTPWFQQILGKGSTLGVKESLIKRRISQTEGVSSIFQFETDFDLANRRYSVQAGILTPFGQATISLTDVL